MCAPNDGIDNAAVRLSELVKNELGVDVNPVLLEAFIKNKWSRISVLAHALHVEPSVTWKLRRSPEDVVAL